MRTVIFLSALLIAEAINTKKVEPDHSVIVFLAITLLVFIVMDLMEFLKNIVR
jgi:hypothetical protein